LCVRATATLAVDGIAVEQSSDVSTLTSKPVCAIGVSDLGLRRRER